MTPEPSEADPVSAPASNAIVPSAIGGNTPIQVSATAEAGAPPPAIVQRSFSPTALLRYWRSILACFIALSVLSVAGIWASIPNMYKATAKIEVSPIVPQLLSDGKTDMFQPYESYRFSQVDHITGTEVLSAALSQESVRATHWYRATPATVLERVLSYLNIRERRPPLERLAEVISAEAPKGKQHIYVSMSTSTPGEARLILDAVVGEYLKFANRRDSDAELEKTKALQNEIRTRQRDLTALQEQAGGLRTRLGSGSPDSLVQQRKLRLDQIEGQLRAVEAKYEIATRAPTAVITSQPVLTTSAPSFAADEEWKRLHQELAATRLNLESQASSLGARHPVVSRLRKLVEASEAALKKREEAITTSGTAGVVVAGTNTHDLAVEKEVLEQTLNQERREFEDIFRDAEALIKLNNSSTLLTETLGELRQKLERIEMNRQVAGRIATFAAYEPSTPEKDRRWSLTIAAIFGSLAASCGLAFLRVRSSPTVDTITDVPGSLEAVFLGRLPLQQAADFAALEQCLAVSESVRMLRTALLNRLENNRGKAIQVTSASPGSGKSTLTVLLGRSLAQIGKRVLLVDTDVHHPMLAKHFDAACSPGLIDVLLTRSLAAKAICSTSLPTLNLLPAGNVKEDFDRELLANGVFNRLLTTWRQQYDFVLLDSGPLLDVADSAILSRQVDGTIFVIREQHCRHAAVRRALAALDTAGGNLMGMVFVGSGSGDRYGYGYNYGYGYGYGYADRQHPPVIRRAEKPTGHDQVTGFAPPDGH